VITRVTACTLAQSPIRDTLTGGSSHFVISMTVLFASDGSVYGWDLHLLESAALLVAHSRPPQQHIRTSLDALAYRRLEERATTCRLLHTNFKSTSKIAPSIT